MNNLSIHRTLCLLSGPEQGPRRAAGKPPLAGAAPHARTGALRGTQAETVLPGECTIIDMC